MSNHKLKITQEIIIPAPLDQVWGFLLNEEKMKSWFNADEFVIDAFEGGKIEIPLFFGDEKVIIEGEIGLVLPKEKFVFTWMERDRFGEIWFNNTSVTIQLKETKTGTRFSLTHDGFKYLPADDQEKIYRKYVAFWENSNILERLQSLIMEFSS